jgi:hypothetical protein
MSAAQQPTPPSREHVPELRSTRVYLIYAGVDLRGSGLVLVLYYLPCGLCMRGPVFHRGSSAGTVRWQLWSILSRLHPLCVCVFWRVYVCAHIPCDMKKAAAAMRLRKDCCVRNTDERAIFLRRAIIGGVACERARTVGAHCMGFGGCGQKCNACL